MSELVSSLVATLKWPKIVIG